MPDLNVGDYLFLGFLGRGPASAYDIKKAMAGSVSFFWSAQHSQVYQQAKRLLRDGYVKQDGEPAGRNRRHLRLTGAGRAALRHWLGSPEATSRYFDEGLGKLFFAGLAGQGAGTAERLLEAELARHRGQLAQYRAIERRLQDTPHPPSGPAPGGPAYELYTLRFGIAFERAAIGWAEQTLRELRADSGRPGTRRTSEPAPGERQL
jgi:PadR family transcriptional regulator AphA